MYEYDFLERRELTRIDTSLGRFYRFEGRAYPSVTTVISKSLGGAGLRAWREWVGDYEADKIKTQACNRGEAFHRIAENYLLSRDYKSGEMPVNLYDFASVRPHLDRISKIYGCELSMGSHKLKTAGTSDVVCEFDGVPSILDFKTSRKKKKEEYLLGFFVQATVYASMVEELYGLRVPQIVVILMTDHEEPEVHVRQKTCYEKKVEEIFSVENYRNLWREEWKKRKEKS